MTDQQSPHRLTGPIAAFMAVKDGIRLGYPFVEAIRCVLPFVNDFWVSDGYSSDGTQQALDILCENHSQVHICSHEWPKGLDSGFAIGAVTNMLMDVLRPQDYRWLWYVQADELWRADLAFAALKLMSVTDSEAISVSYLHLAKNFQQLQFPPGKESYTQAVRIVRNLPHIRSHRDAWTFEGWRSMSFLNGGDVVHANSTWWEHWAVKARSHAEHLYADLAYYAATAEEREREMAQAEQIPELWTRTESPFEYALPEWIKDTIGWPRYRVREELLR